LLAAERLPIVLVEALAGKTGGRLLLFLATLQL
jgi:hypothetical protein